MRRNSNTKFHHLFLFHGLGHGKPPVFVQLEEKDSTSFERKKEDELLIKERLSVFEKYLSKAEFKKEHPAIIVGCEDFFAVSFTDRFYDLETVYSMFFKEFVAISLKYPHIIFTPGSLNVSVPIPTDHQNIKFYQEANNRLMNNNGCYFSNLMPIFYNGELLRIIRKGELAYLTRQVTPLTGKNIKIERIAINSTEEISDYLKIDKNFKLFVVSFHEDEYDNMLKKDNEPIPSCYLGKTLLPGEEKLIKKYCGNNINLSTLFSHEAVIDKQSFCFLICGEFRGDSLPKWFGKETTVGALLEKKAYDYIIHSSVGGDLNLSMYKNSKCYIHSDKSDVNVSAENKVILDGTTLATPDSVITEKDHDLQVSRYLV